MNQETRLVYFHSIVKFIMNHAHYTGGAIKITGVDSNNPFCVFSNHPPEMEISPSDNMGLLTIMRHQQEMIYYMEVLLTRHLLTKIKTIQCLALKL